MTLSHAKISKSYDNFPSYMKPNLGHAHLFIMFIVSDGMRVVDFTEHYLPQ